MFVGMRESRTSAACCVLFLCKLWPAETECARGLLTSRRASRIISPMTNEQTEAFRAAHRHINETFKAWCSEENHRNPDSEKTEADRLAYLAAVDAVNELNRSNRTQATA